MRTMRRAIHGPGSAALATSASWRPPRCAFEPIEDTGVIVVSVFTIFLSHIIEAHVKSFDRKRGVFGGFFRDAQQEIQVGIYWQRIGLIIEQGMGKPEIAELSDADKCGVLFRVPHL